jgi:hypothetical protein
VAPPDTSQATMVCWGPPWVVRLAVTKPTSTETRRKTPIELRFQISRMTLTVIGCRHCFGVWESLKESAKANQ